MSDVKSVKELAGEFTSAYEAVKPFEKALNERVNDTIKIIKDFRRANSWYGGKWDWVDARGYISVDSGNVIEDGIYVVPFYGEFEEFTFTFDEMDSINEILVKDFEDYKLEREERDLSFKAARRAQLEAELAELS